LGMRRIAVLITDLLEQIASWEADISATSQEIPQTL
jgi:hypothetical protein